MEAPRPWSIVYFRAWAAVRERWPGRLIRWVRDALDPFAYATWYAYMWMHTRHPTTFNEKIRYKMVRDRRPMLKTFADKVAVRDYIVREVGHGYLTELYQVHETADAVRWDELPREFVCKASHASGGAIIVSESADPSFRLPPYVPSGYGRYVVHPDAFDPDRATVLLHRWLTTPYGWSGWKREWAYYGIPPRVLVEELLRGSDGGVPPDYKFYIFNGRCGFVEVVMSRFGEYMIDVFTPEWEYLPVDYERRRSHNPQPPPARLQEMLTISERLGAGTDFVRVDLYAPDNRIVIGELTNYPTSGKTWFDPPEYDGIVGSWWEVPVHYR